MTTSKDRTLMTRNGYALNTAGAIEIRRGEHLTMERHRHSHLACIRLTVADTKAAAGLISAVIAAVSDEPGEILIGTNKTDLLLLFKLGSTYNVEVRSSGNDVHPLVYRDASGLFFATADAEVNTDGFNRVSTAFNVGDYTWRENLSPLNNRRDALAPLYPDTAKRAYEAADVFLRENSGRWGPLKLPETKIEQWLREAQERKAANLAAGITDETEPEDADALLVAANPTLRATDGPIGVLVHEARRRVDARNEAARLEKKRLAQEKKDADKRAKDMAVHIAASA